MSTNSNMHGNNGRSVSTGSSARSVVDEEDRRAGYVDVTVAAPPPNHPNVVIEEHHYDRSSAVGSSGGQRRVSPLDPYRRGTPPTRVMEIPQAHPEHHDEQEQNSSPRRRVTPTTRRRSSNQQQNQQQYTYEELANRPRSNPRERTPMRFESPLHEHAFRPEMVRENEAETHADITTNNTVNEARRVTIRPMAGSAVGTVAPAGRVSQCSYVLFSTFVDLGVCNLLTSILCYFAKHFTTIY